MISLANDMLFREGFIYLTDYENGRILRLDQNLDVMDQWGRPGTGPGEFEGPGPLFATEDLLLACNQGRHQIYFFDSGGNLENIIHTPGLRSESSLVFEGGFFYVPSPGLDNEHAVQVLDMEGNKLRGMVPAFPSENPRERRARSNLYLCRWAKDGQVMLVAVSETEPKIELYALDGTLINQKTVANHPTVAARIELREAAYAKSGANRARGYMIFRDAEVFEDKLYALAIGDGYSCILVFDLLQPNLALERTIRVPFSLATFTVENHKSIYGHDFGNRGIIHFQPSI